MAINKKNVQQSETPEIGDLHTALSKAALMDIVIDLVRRNAGDEMLDGVELARAIVREGEPVLIARGDKPPVVIAVPRCSRCAAHRVRGGKQSKPDLCNWCYADDHRPAEETP